jgi:hypothetical protein
VKSDGGAARPPLRCGVAIINYSTVYVATVGKPYPIRITGIPGALAADIHFEAWNEPVKVRAPAGAVWWDSIP